MDSIVMFFGAAEKGLQAKKRFNVNYNNEKLFFVDNDPQKIGKRLDDVEIISPQEMLRKFNNNRGMVKIILCIYDMDKVVKQLRDNSIYNNVYGFNSKTMVIYSIDVKKPRLDYIEYHVSHHCNLKCKGCSHLSNITDVGFGNLEQFEKDIIRLKELFWGIKTIRLLGGEPLLNYELNKFIITSRSVFPDSDIRVVSNGLLIPTINDDILSTMKENGVCFDISTYPPTQKIKDVIKLRCAESGVECIFSPVIEEFTDFANYDGDSDKVINFNLCNSKKCHFLEDGKISVCPRPFIFKRNSKIIGDDFTSTVSDIIDLYDEQMDGYKLLDIFSMPIESCRYCNMEHPNFFKWTSDLINN